MAVKNKARQRGRFCDRSQGVIMKAHALYNLCDAEVALVIVKGSERYTYRSDDTTTWPLPSQIVRLFRFS